MSDASVSRSTRTRAVLGSGTTFMVVGTLVAALAAYLFQLIVGRALGPTDFAPITVLWTIQFLVFTTVFMPMEQLTIRRLHQGLGDAAPWSLFLTLIAASTAGAAAFAWATTDRLLDGEVLYVPLTAVLVASYGMFALGRGHLAGHERYREYGLSTLAESALRLVAAIVLLGLGAGTLGLAWTLLIGAFVILAWRPFRGAWGSDKAVEPGSASALATFISANAASQTIVAAGPLVVGALGAPAAEVSVFFETFLLFRAPLTVAYSLVARVLPPFTRYANAGGTANLRKWVIRLAGAAGLLSVAAYGVGRAIGPALVEVMLGAEFRPAAGLAAYAAAGVVIATLALFAQQILIAMRATDRLAAAWLFGLIVAVIVISVSSGDPSMRVGAAFLAGEAAACAGIAVAVLTIRD